MALLSMETELITLCTANDSLLEGFAKVHWHVLKGKSVEA